MCNQSATCHEQTYKCKQPGKLHDTRLVQAEYVRVPMADSTLIPTPASVTDKEALLVGDVLPTGKPPHLPFFHSHMFHKLHLPPRSIHAM